MSIFNKLRQKQSEQLEHTRKAYWRLLDAMDINKPTKQQAVDLERMLQELGKSAEDAEEDHKYVVSLRKSENEYSLLVGREQALAAMKTELREWKARVPEIEKENRKKTLSLQRKHSAAYYDREKSVRAGEHLKSGYDGNPEIFEAIGLRKI